MCVSTGDRKKTQKPGPGRAYGHEKRREMYGMCIPSPSHSSRRTSPPCRVSFQDLRPFRSSPSRESPRFGGSPPGDSARQAHPSGNCFLSGRSTRGLVPFWRFRPGGLPVEDLSRLRDCSLRPLSSVPGFPPSPERRSDFGIAPLGGSTGARAYPLYRTGHT
jgi:hypothetical protein